MWAGLRGAVLLIWTKPGWTSLGICCWRLGQLEADWSRIAEMWWLVSVSHGLSASSRLFWVFQHGSRGRFPEQEQEWKHTRSLASHLKFTWYCFNCKASIKASPEQGLEKESPSFFFLRPHCTACRIIVPQSKIKPMPPPVKAESKPLDRQGNPKIPSIGGRSCDSVHFCNPPQQLGSNFL